MEIYEAVYGFEEHHMALIKESAVDRRKWNA